MKNRNKILNPKPSVNLPRKRILPAELITGLISKYLVLTTILMLAGLLFGSDASMHGFPFPWYGHGGIDLKSFIPSVLICAAIVAAGDIAAKSIIRLKEPKLKINTKIPPSAMDLSNTIEMSVYDISDSADTGSQISSIDILAEDNNWDIKDKSVKSHQFKKLLNGEDSSTDIQEGKKGGSLVIAFIIITFVLTILLPIIASDDFDSENITINDDEIVYEDENSIDIYVEDSIKLISELLFDDIAGGTREYLSEFASDEQIEEFYSSFDYENVGYINIHTYISHEGQFALAKYVMTDSEGEDYLMAHLMKLEIDEESGEYGCSTQGISICAYSDIADTIDELYDSESWPDAAEEIKENKIDLGTTHLDAIPILIWDENQTYDEIDV